MSAPLDRMATLDMALVRATEAGLPLTPDPYGDIGRAIGASRDQVIARLAALMETGAIRRIGLVPNHYRLGLIANGMAVFDVVDAEVDVIGERVGALTFVTHCYRRPRHGADWPFNLFAMVHGADRAEAEAKAAEIAGLIGPALRQWRVLVSTRILKKTGLRTAPRRADTVPTR